MIHSLKSLAPYACAVNPLFPMRINTQFQYIKLKIVVPTANAPMVVSPLGSRPAIAISTMPKRGIVTLEIALGIAKLSIFLCTKIKFKRAKIVRICLNYA